MGKNFLLLDKQYSNCTKKVAIYTEILDDEDGEMFNIDYDIEYVNGEGKQGNAFVSLEDTLASYGFGSYDEQKKYFEGKYKDDENAFQKIVKELDEKGLDPNVDETNETKYW